jgi:hypothetical protein
MHSPPKEPMDKDVRITLILIGGLVAIALIIAGGCLVNKWMELQQPKNITMILPGGHA